MSAQDREDRFAPAGFFVLRTPLLSFDELATWTSGAEGREALRARLAECLAKAELREALYVASPALDEGLRHWREDPAGKRGRRAELALLRYLHRAGTRATPFGLFAGSSFGTVGDSTVLTLAGRDSSRRRTRFDFEFLVALVQGLARDPSRNGSLAFRPNSSLFAVDGKVRYFAARPDGRSYSQVTVELSPPLAETLARADREEGARPAELAAALTQDPEVSLDEAVEYVQELIESELLVPAVFPALTGPEPAEVLIPALERAGLEEVAGPLRIAQSAFAALDASGPGGDPACYEELCQSLASLSSPYQPRSFFQVDLEKPAPGLAIGPAVTGEILRATEILRRIWMGGHRRGANLATFRRRFEERYGDREVPLLQVLDEETGLGYSPGQQFSASPLIRSLPFDDSARGPVEETECAPPLLRLLSEALLQGSRRIDLRPEDLDRLASPHPPELPSAWSALVSLAAPSVDAVDRGDFELLVRSISGPSGARLLGRFCHGSAPLCRAVEQYLRAEEALDPEAIHAEVVHLPEWRLGNVILRPLLRRHEIAYLGVSGAPAQDRIAAGGLLLSVRDDRLTLRCAHTGRRVVPRMANAHASFHSPVPVYRFLCDLEGDGEARTLRWEWGGLTASVFLPQVRAGRAVLARATWNVAPQESALFARLHGSALVDALGRWRETRRIPRRVVMPQADHELFLDLEDLQGAEMLAEIARKEQPLPLVEMFPGTDRLCVQGPEGRFTHELVVPFLATRPAAGVAPPPLGAGVRREAPLGGSPWLEVRLWGGERTLGDLLRHVLAPLLASWRTSGILDLWSFSRLDLPERHGQVRLHGDPRRLAGEVAAELGGAVQRFLDDERLHRITFDTCESPEPLAGTARRLAEIAQADSEAVLEILRLADEAEDPGLLWPAVLLGSRCLLEDLGLDPAAAVEALTARRLRLSRLLQTDPALDLGIAAQYRQQRPLLDALFVPGRAEGGQNELRRIFAARSPAVAELRRFGVSAPELRELALRLVGQHVRRVLPAEHTRTELVLCEFLLRHYRSRLAR